MGIDQTGTNEFPLDVYLLYTIVELSLRLLLQRGDFALLYLDGVFAV